MTFSELAGNGNDAAITQTIGHTGSSTGPITTQFPGAIASGASGGGVAGIFQCPEGTAPSGTASVDLFYCDSTAHRVKAINNNGSAATYALFTDNLSVFSSTNSAQLFGLLSDETAPDQVHRWRCSIRRRSSLPRTSRRFRRQRQSVFALVRDRTAVDGVTVNNAATANPATVGFTASGSDTNVNLSLNGKGSGQVTVGTGPAVTTPGTGAGMFWNEGTQPANVAAGSSGFVADSTLHCPAMWENSAEVGCPTYNPLAKTGTNTAGTDNVLAAGLGTGNATSHIKLQTPTFSTTSSSTAQTEVTAYHRS